MEHLLQHCWLLMVTDFLRELDMYGFSEARKPRPKPTPMRITKITRRQQQEQMEPTFPSFANRQMARMAKTASTEATMPKVTRSHSQEKSPLPNRQTAICRCCESTRQLLLCGSGSRYWAVDHRSVRLQRVVKSR